ncbi:hypothetical protein M404DRAFT_32882 [Pisolithus tinctorius Marx 270]|uniref:CCHC-type domain-containing protein n=1 Tax=Pisolithus tinctorius Marx 270 TaxID=870435 RepID=A0A0C3N719_PISTI|nr:hypothetical protein M404DRAFT_32882 [Pisolithus tinctorius Marx 270]
MAVLPQTPTLLQPVGLAGDPSDDGLGDDDNNNPDEGDPSNDPDDNGPSDDNPDDDDPADKPDFPDPDTEPAITVLDNLTSAIKLLACNARTSPESLSRTKLHEPNTFNGTDPKKLHTFFIQCMALEWFKPDLLGLNDPNNWRLWMDSWREFILELQTTFGPHNLVADAKSQLDHLHMKESYRDGALRHHFYSGLPDWIKDKLCHLAQEIDACYWECKEQVQWASKHQGLSNSSNHKSGGSGNNSQPKTSQDKSKTGSNNNSGSSPKPASSKPGNSNNSNSPKPKPSKLGKDRKLTPEECKHCIDGNLCMFCGGSSHFTNKCPKKAGKAKAHAAATTEATLASGSGSTPETKK